MGVGGGVVDFVFYYPLIMSIVWIIGALFFYARRERGSQQELFRMGEEMPRVSVIVPCFNEEATIRDTVENLQGLTYPNYEVIVVDDGSQDRTAAILRDLAGRVSYLRVIHSVANRGKAHALKLGLLASQGEILVTVDSDAMLNSDALDFLVPHFITPYVSERVGAVTGNPRVRNRSSLLAKIQLLEYASIIGLIKRSQRVLGKIMTVSGVIVAFRKRALIDSGLWDTDIITEDIAVTWKLEQHFWDVRYEPKALCWMLVPETAAGLWKQRVRWAQGGLEVLQRHWRALLHWKQRRMWPILVEQLISLAWVVTWLVLTVVLVMLMVVRHRFYVPILWMGTYLAVVSLIQIAVAMAIDRRYERGNGRYYWWSIWYPSVYWFVNAVVVLYAFGRMLLHRHRRGDYAVWASPDRGIGEDSFS